MTTATASSSAARVVETRPRSSAAYDWLMGAVASCMGGGAYIDGWAHNHALRTGAAIETFFTPWHALLYGGYALVVVALAVSAVRSHVRGFGWQASVPRGYELSALGAGIFFLGGVLDLLWHTLFGIEASTSALLSPTHLMLLAGAVLIYLGPLRSVVGRNPERTSWTQNGPVVLSLLWLLSSFTFFTQYASPFASTIASSLRVPPADFIDLFHALGVAGVALQSALLAGVLLYGVKIGRLPTGAFTAIVTLNVLLVTAMRVDMVSVAPLVLTAGALVSGIVIDVLYAWLQPETRRPAALKLFAFLAPAIVYVPYFAAIAAFGGTYWSVHLVTGCVVTAGLVGLLLSYLVAPVGSDF